MAEGNAYELTTNQSPVTPHLSCTVQSGAEEEESGMSEIEPGGGGKIKGQGSCFVSHYPNLF